MQLLRCYITRLLDSSYLLQRKCRLGQGADGEGHEQGLVVVAGDAVGAERAAGATAVDNRPFAAAAHPDRHRFHRTAALGGAVAGGIVEMPAPQTLRTMVAMARHRARGIH
jgi:hypothetical protein